MISAHRATEPPGAGTKPSRFFSPGIPGGEPDCLGLYLAPTLKLCFVETIVRDRRDGGVETVEIERSVIETRCVAKVSSTDALTLVDLSGENAGDMGVPTDACGARDHGCGQMWGRAIFAHPEKPDGIYYPSRLIDGAHNIAVHARALHKLVQEPDAVRLTACADYPDLLDKYKIALIDP